jgi:SAM-dependent methyltransferase
MGRLQWLKRSIRAGLIGYLPGELRRKLVARFPRLPLAPYSVGESGAKFDGSAWERFYAAPDPYHLADSEYERLKYERTLACIGDGPFVRALEVGCSVGVFTSLLAPRCERLVAVDIAENAIRQARARVARFTHVSCERRTLPHEMPAGVFDLIVCSDVLYYWPAEKLREGLRVLESVLSPGGRLVAVHYTGNAESGTPLDGNAVHDLLTTETVFAHTFAATHDKYRIDRLERAAGSPRAAGYTLIR